MHGFDEFTCLDLFFLTTLCPFLGSELMTSCKPSGFLKQYCCEMNRIVKQENKYLSASSIIGCQLNTYI